MLDNNKKIKDIYSVKNLLITFQLIFKTKLCQSKKNYICSPNKISKQNFYFSFKIFQLFFQNTHMLITVFLLTSRSY
jgi:hypothetical protein